MIAVPLPKTGGGMFFLQQLYRGVPVIIVWFRSLKVFRVTEFVMVAMVSLLMLSSAATFALKNSLLREKLNTFTIQIFLVTILAFFVYVGMSASLKTKEEPKYIDFILLSMFTSIVCVFASMHNIHLVDVFSISVAELVVWSMLTLTSILSFLWIVSLFKEGIGRFSRTSYM